MKINIKDIVKYYVASLQINYKLVKHILNPNGSCFLLSKNYK